MHADANSGIGKHPEAVEECGRIMSAADAAQGFIMDRLQSKLYRDICPAIQRTKQIHRFRRKAVRTRCNGKRGNRDGIAVRVAVTERRFIQLTQTPGRRIGVGKRLKIGYCR